VRGHLRTAAVYKEGSTRRSVIALYPRFSVWFQREIVESPLGPVHKRAPEPERRPGRALAMYNHIQSELLEPAAVLQGPPRGRPLSPLAISRSTEQKRFQSLKQPSPIGFSATPTRRVLFADTADLSAIAVMLLAIRSSVTNIWRTNVSAECDSRHNRSAATQQSPALARDSIRLPGHVSRRPHRWDKIS
jgi:hypothetical protein